MRIEGIISGQINLSNISDILSKLNIGDIVRAQVLDIMSDEMLLKLFDGTTFTASNMAKAEVSKGEFIDLEVNAKNENQLFLEVVKDKKVPHGIEDDLKKQLEALKVSTKPINLEVATEVKKQGYPFSKDLIEKAADTVIKLRNLDVKSAVFLSANDVETSKISTLKHMIEGKIKIASDLTELIEKIKQNDDPKVLSEIERRFQEADRSDRGNRNQNIEKNTENYEDSNTRVLEKTLNTELVKLKDGGLKVAANSEITDRILNTIKSEKSVPDHIIDKVTKLLDVYKQETVNAEKIEKEFGELLKNIIQKNETNQTSKQIFYMTDDEIKDVKDKIIKSLGKIFVKVDSENLEKDINIKKIYKDLGEKLDIIKDSIINSTHSKSAADIASKIDSMESNIKFCTDISNFNSYYQIPLIIQNNSTTGQLYILKRDSKAKKINPENASMLISLDTQNMGRVDSLVSINHKNVSIGINVEAEELFEFIRQHSTDLYTSLAKKGYKLVDLRYKLMEEPVNVLNAENIARKETEGRVSIDYRI